jgi:hypothetical protein
MNTYAGLAVLGAVLAVVLALIAGLVFPNRRADKKTFDEGWEVEHPNFEFNEYPSRSLPEGIPHREILLENQIDNLHDLVALDDFTSLDKIGEARAQNIDDFLQRKAEEMIDHTETVV